MLRYAESLESRAASIEEGVEAVISEASEEVSFVKVEWVLKHAHTNRRRLNDKQKNYLIELFLFGEKTGRKAHTSVSKTTRKARNEDGSLLFQSDEYLTSLQIASFFSRRAAKKSELVSSSTSDLANQDYRDDFLSAMTEKELD